MDLREEIEKYKAILKEDDDDYDPVNNPWHGITDPSLLKKLIQDAIDMDYDEFREENSCVEDLADPREFWDEYHGEEDEEDGELDESFLDSSDEEESPVKQAITRRIMHAHPKLLSQYGDEAVMAAIDDVASFAGHPDEIGSSDVRIWVNQVIKQLSQSSEEVNESSDSNKPHAVIQTGGAVGEAKKGVVKRFDDWGEAQVFAKKRNKGLTPGEKGYYKIRYVAKKNYKEQVVEMASGDLGSSAKKTFVSARNREQFRAQSGGVRGYVTTTYQKLVDTFGRPMIGPDANEDKTTCEWQIKFSDGVIATIYDWKENATPMHEYGWHVGGVSPLAVTNVEEALGITKESKDGSAGNIAITENELCEGCGMPVEECMCESNVGMYESEMDTIMKLSGIKEASEKSSKDATEKVNVDAFDEDETLANGPDEKTLSTETQLTSNDDLHRSSKKMYKRAQPGDNPKAVAEAERKLKQKYAKFLNEQK